MLACSSFGLGNGWLERRAEVLEPTVATALRNVICIGDRTLAPTRASRATSAVAQRTGPREAFAAGLLRCGIDISLAWLSARRTARAWGPFLCRARDTNFLVEAIADWLESDGSDDARW
jgi:hypothetical protein